MQYLIANTAATTVLWYTQVSTSKLSLHWKRNRTSSTYICVHTLWISLFFFPVNRFTEHMKGISYTTYNNQHLQQCKLPRTDNLTSPCLPSSFPSGASTLFHCWPSSFRWVAIICKRLLSIKVGSISTIGIICMEWRCLRGFICISC